MNRFIENASKKKQWQIMLKKRRLMAINKAELILGLRKNLPQ